MKMYHAHHPRLDFQHLKASVSIPTLLDRLGLLSSFSRHGRRLVGPCPLHHGSGNASFVINLDQNLWYCFSDCKTGGDIVSLAQKLLNLGFLDTARYLASLIQAQPSSIAPLPPPPPPRSFVPFTRTMPLDPCHPFLSNKGISPDSARLFETGAFLGNGFLANSIAVRLHDLAGSPLGYAGRSLEPTATHKWKFPPRLPKSSIFYNHHRICNPLPAALVVVECPWAVMRLAQLNIPALALLGTSLSSLQKGVLASIPRVILLLDGDSPGRLASASIVDSLNRHSAVHSVFLPDGLDPDDLNDAHLAAILNHLLS
jgi:DNA primase